MKSVVYKDVGNFEIQDRPLPEIQKPTDAVVRITMSSICSSDLHIMDGSVPRAVKGTVVGHEAVGIVESVGESVSRFKVGDRVAVNVETFCGDCFFCRRGYVNNCEDPNGGWAIGCRIDGVQASHVRIPYADNSLSLIPENVTDVTPVVDEKLQDAIANETEKILEDILDDESELFTLASRSHESMKSA